MSYSKDGPRGNYDPVTSCPVDGPSNEVMSDNGSGCGDTKADSRVYASIVDSFGDDVRAVEPILDAMLEQVSGGPDPRTTDDHRWMTTVIEYGDRAAEDASRLLLLLLRTDDRYSIAADYEQRTTRVASAFAASYWNHFAGPPPTGTDRALASCVVDDLTAAVPELGERLSAEQFAVCLNSKFAMADGRRAPAPPFRPEAHERLDRFTGAAHLADLIGDGSRGALDRSHVEHMGPHVLPQRLVELAYRFRRRWARYFALTDSLVFRFATVSSSIE